MIKCFWFFVFGFPLLAQSNISGSATLQFKDAGLDCHSQTRLVDIYVYVSGLAGDGGLVGVNSFVLAVDINRNDIYASSEPGTQPVLDWNFNSTNRSLVDVLNRVVLVGVVADPLAPNQAYHLARLAFSGATGDFQLSLVVAESSLGSRVVNGDGPDLIPFLDPLPITTDIVVPFDLNLMFGCSFWLTSNADYDVINDDVVNVLDLVKLIYCGG